MKVRALLLFTVLVGAASALAAPRHVYLTRQGDTSTTMTVNFQTPAPAERPAVFFHQVAENAAPEQTRIAARSHQVPGLPDGRGGSGGGFWIPKKILVPKTVPAASDNDL